MSKCKTGGVTFILRHSVTGTNEKKCYSSKIPRKVTMLRAYRLVHHMGPGKQAMASVVSRDPTRLDGLDRLDGLGRTWTDGLVHRKVHFEQGGWPSFSLIRSRKARCAGC